ncbi:SGNH/GDSL hydrolase family protein [Oceanobacillus sp. CAU 1775]
MKKRLFIIIPTIILVIIGSIFIIYTQSQPITQPLIPPEDEVELEEEVTEMEDDIENGDENNEVEVSIAERISQAIQGTIDRMFTREVNIVAIGDSLTRGVGDPTKGGGYVGILERSINVDVEIADFENFGVPGNRTEQLLKRLEQEEIQDGLSNADLVLITIGANDIMQVAKENITNLEIEDFIEERKEYERRLAEILDTIQELNPDADIYLLGIYNPFEKYFQDIAELNMIVEAWNDTGSSLALQAENITFIPVEDLFTGNEDDIFAEDNFHPNYNGYYLIAGRVLEYISNEEG